MSHTGEVSVHDRAGHRRGDDAADAPTLDENGDDDLGPVRRRPCREQGVGDGRVGVAHREGGGGDIEVSAKDWLALQHLAARALHAADDLRLIGLVLAGRQLTTPGWAGSRSSAPSELRESRRLAMTAAIAAAPKAMTQRRPR